MNEDVRACCVLAWQVCVAQELLELEPGQWLEERLSHGRNAKMREIRGLAPGVVAEAKHSKRETECGSTSDACSEAANTLLPLPSRPPPPCQL